MYVRRISEIKEAYGTGGARILVEKTELAQIAELDHEQRQRHMEHSGSSLQRQFTSLIPTVLDT